MFSNNSENHANNNHRTRVPILMYHRIADDPAPGLEPYCVSPAVFRKQIRWLKSKGYAAIPLATLVSHYRNLVSLPERPVVITFDDGYEDNLLNAHRVLDGAGFQATIFLVAGLVGKEAVWDSAFGPPASLLSWDEIRAMAKGPFSFGAHTVTHPHLCEISLEDACKEIANSKAVLEDKLGWKVNFFAYPYSDFNEELRNIVVESGYEAACSSIWGHSDNTDDIYSLRRVIIRGRDSFETFVAKVRGSSSSRSLGVLGPVFRRLRTLAQRGEVVSK